MKMDFPDLSYKAFQHPLDRQALIALQKVKHLDTVIKKIGEWYSEKNFHLMRISNNLRLGPNQGSEFYEKYIQVAKILDLPDVPDLYLDSIDEINAYAFGLKRFTVTLNSGLVELLSEEELLAVIGHELGHVKCHHMLYRTMYEIFKGLGDQFLARMVPFGVGTAISTGISVALYKWYRVAEYSCDRAALLVAQDARVVATALTKLGGFSPKIVPEINLDEVLLQADEYEGADSAVESGLKLLQNVGRSHPLTIPRVKAIMEWSKSKEYEAILAGDYLKASEEEARLNSSSPCNACGAELVGEARFCSSCGAMVDAKPKSPSVSAKWDEWLIKYKRMSDEEKEAALNTLTPEQQVWIKSQVP